MLFLPFTPIEKERTWSTCLPCTWTQFFSSTTLNAGAFLDLERLQAVAPVLQSGRICGIFFPLFSFFIKSWEKKTLVKDISQANPPHFGTISLFVNCQFWHPLSLPTVWQRRGSVKPMRFSPLEGQLSSLHRVGRELVKCAVFLL